MSADDIEKAKQKIYKLLARLKNTTNGDEATLVIRSINAIRHKINIKSYHDHECSKLRDDDKDRTYWTKLLEFLVDFNRTREQTFPKTLLELNIWILKCHRWLERHREEKKY